MAAAGVPEILDDGKLLYVGIGSRGIELEVLAIPDDKHPGGLTVIHAVPTHNRQEGQR